MGTRTDQDILDGSPITVAFGGQEYTWHQKPRREQRKVRTALLSIAGSLSSIEGQTEMDQATGSLDVINAILEFCEDYNPDMCDDIERIEGHIKAKGMIAFAELIEAVYMPIYTAWLEPWIAGDDKAKKKTKKTNTLNPKPTK